MSKDQSIRGVIHHCYHLSVSGEGNPLSIIFIESEFTTPISGSPTWQSEVSEISIYTTV